MKNLINALKQSVGLQNGKLLFGYEGMLFYKVKLLIIVLCCVISAVFVKINRMIFCTNQWFIIKIVRSSLISTHKIKY